MQRFLPLLILCALLLPAACGSDESGKPDPSLPTAALFLPVDGQAKIFFYVVYANPADKPSHHETFRFHIDGGYDGEIRDDQFVETTVMPGNYILAIDEIDWGGFNVHTTTLKMPLQPGELYFLEAHILADKKPVFARTDNTRGMQDIMQRRRLCGC